MSDIALPPRKRRRPALSCEVCRRRKIKCDRSYPCGQCTQSKTARCSYSPDSLPLKEGRKKERALSKISSQSIPDRTQHSSTATPENGEPASDYNPLSATNLTGSWTTPTSTSTSQPQESNKIKALVDDILGIKKNFQTSPVDDFGALEDVFHAPAPPPQDLNGTVSKTRYFGRSHWMHSFGLFDKISCLNVNPMNNTPDFKTGTGEVRALLESCKSLARVAKAEPQAQWQWPLRPNFHQTIPPKEICDQLVDHYLRTSESIYRILQVPTFRKEYAQYWEKGDPGPCPAVYFKLLLVMAIGTGYYEGPDQEYYRFQAKDWILAVQSWISSPFEKRRLNMSCVQIHCLLLIARQDNGISDDLVWISAGALLRVAIVMGLHRDPIHLPKMSVCQVEMRRRLWATILELNVQEALNSGHSLLLSTDDYDTRPPSNINDVDLHEGASPNSKPSDVFTDTSLQLRLLSTFLARLKITKILNGFKAEPPYDEILILSSHLMKACKSNNHFINLLNKETQRVSKLHQYTLDFSIRRFILGVHRPFSAKADAEPRYYFSRKACLDAAMTMLAYPDPPGPGSEPGDYTRISVIGRGYFKGLVAHCTMVIFHELMRTVEESDGLPEEISNAAKAPLKNLLRNIISLAFERVKFEENNVKGFLFTSVVLAQIEAMERGDTFGPEHAGMEAAKVCLKKCEEVLTDRIARMKELSSRAQCEARRNGNYLLGANFCEGNGSGGDGLGNLQDWSIDFNMSDPESWAFPAWQPEAAMQNPWWIPQF